MNKPIHFNPNCDWDAIERLDRFEFIMGLLEAATVLCGILAIFGVPLWLIWTH